MKPLSPAAGASVSEIAPPSSMFRWLVLGVSAALLTLLLASGAVAIRYLRQMHDRQEAVTRELATRTQMLSGLLLSIQSYNQAVQQFVTAKTEHDQADRQRLDQLTLEIDSDLRGYPADRDPMEAALLGGMENLFAQQRTLYISILGAHPDQRREQAENSDARRMLALQKQILDWSTKIQAWNGERFQLADETMVTDFGDLQRGLSRALAIAFGSGLLLVLGSFAYILRLERQTRQRYLQVAHSQRELQRLSSLLLDAQETERRSISRELHDEVGQSLGALLMDIGQLSTAVSGDRPHLRARLDAMKSLAERTFQSVRNIALLLRPSMLDDLGLIPALEWQAREVSRRSEIEAVVESRDVPEDLPDEYRVCIYRLVQEALNNAVRHSGAKNAKVTVERSAGGILVRVSDDGRGFDANRTRGLGILGMEERAKRLAGSLTVESQPGKGTIVTTELPFPPQPPPQS